MADSAPAAEAMTSSPTERTPQAPPPAQTRAPTTSPSRQREAHHVTPTPRVAYHKKEAATARTGTPQAKVVQRFGSTVERFRVGDMLSPAGIPLFNSTRRREEDLDGSHTISGQHVHQCTRTGCEATQAAVAAQSPPRRAPSASARSKSNPAYAGAAGAVPVAPRGATSIQALRSRHPRPTRWAVEPAPDGPAECVGRAVCDAAAICVADSTVWCAERNGTISIREKDGGVFAVVDRDPGAPAITSMLFVPSTFKGSRMLIGHDDGSILALNAATAECCGEYAPLLEAPVTCLVAVQQGQPATLAVAAAEDGRMVLFDVASLTAMSAVMRHPGGVTAAVPLGTHVCTACEDGVIRKWDLQTAVEVSSCRLHGAISDLVSSGRYIWAATRVPSAIAVVDTLCMKVEASVEPPAHTPVTQLLLVGQHCWAVHEDGTINVYNGQTLELTRTVDAGAGSTERVLAAHRVITVPEDHEVWTLTQDGLVHMWRSYEYNLPVWCADAYQAWGEDGRQAQEEASKLRHALNAKDERIAALEAANSRVRDDATNTQQLLQSLQDVVDAKNADLEKESDRRKRAEAELSELRHAVIHAHKTLAPPVQHLLHYKQGDVKGVVGWLTTEVQRGQDAAEQTAAHAESYEALRSMIERAHRELVPGADPAGYGEQGTRDALGVIVANAQGRVVQQQPASSHHSVTPPEAPLAAAADPPSAPATAADVEDLRHQNSSLEHDNQRLKDMLEKLKASHRTVNQQLQAFVQQQAEAAHAPPSHAPADYEYHPAPATGGD